MLIDSFHCLLVNVTTHKSRLIICKKPLKLKNSTQIINSFTINSNFDEYHKETIIKTIIINNQTGLIDFLRLKTISIVTIIINKQTLIIDMTIHTKYSILIISSGKILIKFSPLL